MAGVLLGAHVSVAGGLVKAFERGEAIGCDALQIFVKNASQWQGKPLTEADAEAFRAAHRASRIGPVVAHASYLINLAATDDTILERSRLALADELERADRLGLVGLVVHPGAHLGAGVEAGLAAVARSLDAVLDSVAAGPARLLLENTAGQGTVLGFELEQLATILEASRHRDRLAICLDTCHAFAAGYPLHEEAGHEALLAGCERLLGPERLACFHLNDSQKPFGSRRDRHANIGEGEIGREAFARLLADHRLAGLPMVVETPLGDDEEGHRRDLATLRSLGPERARPGGGRRGARRVSSRRDR